MPKVSIFAGTRNACHCLIACTSLDESSDARCCQIQETSCVSGSRQSPDQSSDGGFSCGISRACVAFLKTIGFLVFRSFWLLSSAICSGWAFEHPTWELLDESPKHWIQLCNIWRNSNAKSYSYRNKGTIIFKREKWL